MTNSSRQGQDKLNPLECVFHGSIRSMTMSDLFWLSDAQIV